MAGIKHAFTSAKADGGDATLVQPGDWNDPHVFEDPVTAAAVFKVKRLSLQQATALVAGDFALSAGWGNTAAVSAVIGTDGAWEITITCGGTSIAVNPTITLTFQDGTWTSSPIGISKIVGGTGQKMDLEDSTTATTWVMTLDGTPVSTKTYIIRGIAIGRA